MTLQRKKNQICLQLILLLKESVLCFTSQKISSGNLNAWACTKYVPIYILSLQIARNVFCKVLIFQRLLMLLAAC
jgi:hypothetical protein